MKIYTKTGDKGETSLLGGIRVPKHHLRIESYGTVDELNSWIGLLRSQKLKFGTLDTLKTIQDRLFTIGSSLATAPGKDKVKIPVLTASDVLLLEKEIDEMNVHLPEMKSFVLPGGSQEASFCHIARCVCRRAERHTTHLSETEEVDPLVIQYLNRLSDYLFVLSRKILVDNGKEEIPWSPAK